jgi:hypothetical protein
MCVRPCPSSSFICFLERWISACYPEDNQNPTAAVYRSSNKKSRLSHHRRESATTPDEDILHISPLAFLYRFNRRDWSHKSIFAPMLSFSKNPLENTFQTRLRAGHRFSERQWTTMVGRASGKRAANRTA